MYKLTSSSSSPDHLRDNHIWIVATSEKASSSSVLDKRMQYILLKINNEQAQDFNYTASDFITVDNDYFKPGGGVQCILSQPLKLKVTARPLAIGFVAFLVASLQRTPKYAFGCSSLAPRLSSKVLAVTTLRARFIGGEQLQLKCSGDQALLRAKALGGDRPARGLLQVRICCLWMMIAFSLLLGTLEEAIAQVSYPQCTQYDALPETANFCPRIEGQYPKGCCPPLQETPITCFYVQESQRSFGVASTYETCVPVDPNDPDGLRETIEEPCCATRQVNCYRDLRERSFIPFLNYRSDESPPGCCYAICPYARYWTDHLDPTKRVPGNFLRLSRRPPNTAMCSGVPSPGAACTTTAVCQSDAPCPLPPGPLPRHLRHPRQLRLHHPRQLRHLRQLRYHARRARANLYSPQWHSLKR